MTNEGDEPGKENKKKTPRNRQRESLEEDVIQFLVRSGVKVLRGRRRVYEDYSGQGSKTPL